MDDRLRDAVALLERTPAALGALLRGLPAVWTHQAEGEGTWSVKDVLGHLMDGERVNWMPRVKHLLEFGESKAFVPFDRLGYVEESQGESLDQLLEEFARVRTASLDQLRALSLGADELGRSGLHPAFGAVRLSELLTTWAVHDLTHLHQISRIMAHQFREDVGPWKAYLGVLKCEGQSNG